MNLESRKYKFHAFLSPNLKQIDAASFDRKIETYLAENLKYLHIFPGFPGVFHPHISEHNVMTTMSNLRSNDLGSSLCSVCY